MIRKILALLILIFFISTNSCYALSELHYFKNIKTSEVEQVADEQLALGGYSIIKRNPYYAADKTGTDYAIIILQQSGENMFYYYRSDKNTKVNKAILKEMKRRGIVCEQSFNQGIIGIYDDIASTLKANSGNEILYTFKEEEPVYKTTNKPSVEIGKMYSGYVMQVPAGIKMNVYLQNSINTATASQGDSVIAVAENDVIYNNRIVIPQGSLVYGTLTKARSATYGSMNGKIVINFNRIVTPDNYVYEITAEEINFAVSNEDKVKETAKNVASKAVVGALVGLLVGVLSDGNIGRSTAIGAGVGAGSSLVYSVAEKGDDAEIPSFTEIELTLTTPFNVSVSN